MRRFQASLIAAGLATTLSSAAAGPSPTTRAGEPTAPPATTLETHEWSMGKGRLGVMVMSLTPELRRHFGVAGDRGVMVAQVEPGTPAAAAGLTAGDIITEVGGKPVDQAGDVLAALARVKAGSRVSIAIVRDEQARTVEATLTGPAAGAGAAIEHWPRWLRDMMRPFAGDHPDDDTFGAFPDARAFFGPSSPCGSDEHTGKRDDAT